MSSGKSDKHIPEAAFMRPTQHPTSSNLPSLKQVARAPPASVGGGASVGGEGGKGLRCQSKQDVDPSMK